MQIEVQEKMQGVLDSLVIDTENDHNTQETAKRVAKMYIQETFGGRYSPMPRVTSFPNMGYKSMYPALGSFNSTIVYSKVASIFRLLSELPF